VTRARSRDEINSVISELHQGAILLDDREVFVHPYIEGSDDEAVDTDHRMASIFLKNLRLLMTHDKAAKHVPILIHFYNCGGYWGPGMQIYDAISTCQTYITSLLHGDAMSMGSIIPLAGDRVIMMPNARLMIHEGTDGMPEMTIKQIRAWAKEGEKNLAKSLEIYAEVCAKGVYFKDWSTVRIKNFITKQMNQWEDWIIDAEQAVDFGFAHGILGEKPFEDVESIKKHEG